MKHRIKIVKFSDNLTLYYPQYKLLFAWIGYRKSRDVVVFQDKQEALDYLREKRVTSVTFKDKQN